jgi:hypothetical protein
MATGPQGQQGDQGPYGIRGVTGAPGWGYGTTTGPTGGINFPTFIDSSSASFTVTSATAGSIYRMTNGASTVVLPTTGTSGNFWTFQNATNADGSVTAGSGMTFTQRNTTDGVVSLPAMASCTLVYSGSGGNYYVF